MGKIHDPLGGGLWVDESYLPLDYVDRDLIKPFGEFFSFIPFVFRSLDVAHRSCSDNVRDEGRRFAPFPQSTC